MEFRVLGPLEVVAAGKTLASGGTKQRALLALLVLRTPDPVSTERVIDALWGERPPASAKHAVHVYISEIRRMLPGTDNARVVSCDSAGYRLEVDPDLVDAKHFERLLREGREALQSGAFEDADRCLGDALALWRGPAYADFLFMDFALTEAARLEELRVDGLEARLEARIWLRDFALVVAELESLVAEHRLREHARALLMRALYGAGRQADALAAYRDGARILREELGLEPGRELRQLEQAILRQAPMADVGSHEAPPKPADERFPLPAALRRAPRLGYVGRTEQLEFLRECWTAAREGSRRGLLVSGEPGVGKTQFIARAARELHEAGALVLLGRCSEEIAAPYGPWIQALSRFIEQASDATLAAHVERHGGEIGRLVPGLVRRLPQAPAPRRLDPESERYLLFWAVVGLLEQAATPMGLVLMLEDLHWADGASLALKHVLAESHGLRLLVVGSYRDSDLSRAHPLTRVLADLRREEQIERLHLGGLDEHEVRLLVDTATGSEELALTPAAARTIASETGGNPFFVGEILRHLVESGNLARTAHKGGSSPSGLTKAGLPQSVREVVLRRVERLGEDGCEALRCASVIGARFDLDLLARVCRKESDALIDVLDRGVAATLLEEDSDGVFSFAHDLILFALYDTLGATWRSRTHRRVAEAIEEACGDDRQPWVEELARHWLHAMPPDVMRARSYSRQAGEQALTQLAPDEAARWFTQALDLLKASVRDPAEECELTILLGEAQRRAGRSEFRQTLLRAADLADDIGDAERMALAALANSRGFASSFGRVDRERVAVLGRAVDMTRSNDPTRCARLLSLQAMELQFDPDFTRRRALADEALTLARATGDVRSLPYVLRDHFHATWSVDTLEARRRTAAEMTRLAAEADDPLVRIWALDRTIHVAVESGALDVAVETASLLQASTEQLGQPGLRWHGAYFAAGLAHLLGDLRESERLADGARHLGEQAAEPDTLVVYFGQLAMIRNEQGRGEEIVAMLEQAAAENTGMPLYQAGLAAVLCDLGRSAAAARLLDSRAVRGFETIPRDQMYLAALALWGKVAAEVKAEREAAALYDLIEPWRNQVIWTGAIGYGSAEPYLGMLAATLGSHERAHHHFAAGSWLHEREGMKVWEARNLCASARSLLAASDRDEAIATATRALALARAHGYKLSELRAAEILESAVSAAPGRMAR